MGFVECYKEGNLCTKLGLHSGLKFYDVAKIEAGDGTKITSLDAQEITREVLNFLPEMKLLNEENFKVRKL